MIRYAAIALTLGAVLLTDGTQAIAITLLHEFAGGANDGGVPQAGLTLSGSTLFGTTSGGGDNGIGTIFSIETDGSGFALLHEFAGGPNGASSPFAGLTLAGSTLFGTTQVGGVNDQGTVFSIETDGSGFALLHEFAGGANDGEVPVAGLTLSGSTLFGTTIGGGDNSIGTIFSVETDGSGFALLHEFAGSPNDGETPLAGLTLSGSTLFGTTQGGGNGIGTIISIETDGSGFALLHEFAGGSTDGTYPRGDLILSGSTLFGTTQLGGDNDFGTVFSIETDGSGFALLHEFAGSPNDGYLPVAGLTLNGSTLFGTTIFGGDNSIGTIFSIETDGSGFALLHEFAGGANDGREPIAGLTLSGSTLFGTTQGGGTNDLGTVFSLEVPAQIPEPGSLILVILGGVLATAGYGLRQQVRQPCR